MTETVFKLDALCPRCGNRWGDHPKRYEIAFECDADVSAPSVCTTNEEKETDNEERRTHGVRRIPSGDPVVTEVEQTHGRDAAGVEPPGERDDDLRRRAGTGVGPRSSEARCDNPDCDEACAEIHGHRPNETIDEETAAWMNAQMGPPRPATSKARPQCVQCVQCECRPARHCDDCLKEERSPWIDDDGAIHCRKCSAQISMPRAEAAEPDGYFTLPDPVEAWLEHEWPTNHDDRAREALRALLDEVRRDAIEGCLKVCATEAVYWTDRQAEGLFACENIEGQIRKLKRGTKP